jgi:hypothetical protein
VQRSDVTVNIQRREPQGGCVAKKQRLALGFRVRDYSDRHNLVENIRRRE